MPTVILSFFFGTLTSILAATFFEWLRRPTLTIVVCSPDEKEYPAGHPIAQRARFLNVRMENRKPRRWLRWLSRHAALVCEADVNFLHIDDQRDVFGRPMPGRWSGWPEPLTSVGRIGDQRIELINPYFMSPQFRRIDIYSGAPGSLDIAVRFDDDAECYGWTTENYNRGWKNADWRLPAGRYLVRVNVRADAAQASADFLLVNDTAIGNFRLEPA